MPTSTVLSGLGGEIPTFLNTQNILSMFNTLQQSIKMNIFEFSHDESYTVPIPTMAVIDSLHSIKSIDIQSNYGTRSEVADIVSSPSALNQITTANR